jgi:undecaprenyl-diphosphatase
MKPSKTSIHNRRRYALLSQEKKIIQNTIAKPPVVRRRSKLIFAYIPFATLSFSMFAWLAYTQPHSLLDVYLTSTIQQYDSDWVAYLMQAVSSVGRSPQFIVIVMIITSLLIYLRLRWEALVSFCTIVVAYFLSVGIKLAIARPRPNSVEIETYIYNDSHSFPSGHVLTYTVYFGFLWFLTFVMMKKGNLRRFLLFLWAGLVLLVGPSRIYLGEHWTSDVVGAYFLGSLILILTLTVYRKMASRS